MHQPVTQSISLMSASTIHQICTNHASYTQAITHQDLPTSSTIHLMYVSTHQLLVSTMHPTCTSTIYQIYIYQYNHQKFSSNTLHYP
jgi:hypothetical protein